MLSAPRLPAHLATPPPSLATCPVNCKIFKVSNARAAPFPSSPACLLNCISVCTHPNRKGRKARKMRGNPSWRWHWNRSRSQRQRNAHTVALLPLPLQLAYVVRGTWHAAVGIAFNYAQRTVKMLKNANYALQHAKCNAGKIVAHNLCHTWLPDSALYLSFCIYLSLWLSLSLSASGVSIALCCST